MLILFYLACNAVNDKNNDYDQLDETGLIDTSELDPGVPTDEPVIIRLTHVQWENTMQSLMHLSEPTGFSELFIGDTLTKGFDNTSDDLIVGAMLFQDYQRAAEHLSENLRSDPHRYSQIVLEDQRTGGSTVAYSLHLEGENLIGTTGQAGGNHYNLWSAGTLDASIEIPQSGEYVISSNVWGSVCDDGLGANMSLLVDGLEIATYENIVAEQVVSESVNLSPGSHNIAISFNNDCYVPEDGFDRNLYIDWISIEGGQTLGESNAGMAEAEAWIRRFGSLAYRRPLQNDEVNLYLDLFEKGPELVNTGDDFADGVQIVLQAMLQSPSTLYRIITTPPGDALSDHELAAKLSYNICNAPPDEELRTIADATELQNELESQAIRLINDDCGEDRLLDLHRQLFHTEAYENIVRDDPSWNPSLNEDMAKELDLFVSEALFVENGGLRELLTADYSVANERIAALYGVDESPGWLRRELDPSQRAGVLTLSGFLSKKAEGLQSDPIHRGVFINESLLCTSLPPPPDNVSGLPELTEGMTNRQRVDAHTGDGTCGAGCHSLLINPPGFAFENYEGLGRYRTEDNGQPVDSSGLFYIDGIERQFNDGIDFIWLLAESEQAHHCYVGHLYQYVLGRDSDTIDEAALESLAQSSLNDSSVLELMLEIIQGEGFTHRSAE